MSNPYDIRLRQYTPGGSAGHVLPALEIEWTAPVSDVPALTFKAAEIVTGVLPDLLEVAVELWDGATWAEPRNGRFFVLNRSGDGLDQTGVRSYTSAALTSYMLSKCLVVTADGTKLPSSNTVGKTVGGVFRAAQARGWGASLSLSFTDSHDSAGAPWDSANTGLEGLEFDDGSTLKAMLQSLADQNSLEYSLTGRVLDVYNAGTGFDLSAGTGRVTVGEAAKELPVTTTLEDLATHVTIRGEGGARWVYPIPMMPGATESMGRLEMSVDAGGVSTEPQAARVADLYQVTGSAPRHSYTITEPAAAMTARPFIEYRTGDWVSARRPNGWQRMRVVQVQIRRDATAALEIDVILDDIMTDLATRLAKRNAGRVGGSGSMPSSSDLGGGGFGGGSGGKLGTLAAPWGDDTGARVIFEGDTDPDGIRYRWLDHYQPVSADPVALSAFGDAGELIIMGRVKGLYIPNGDQYQGKYLHRALDERADTDPSRVTDFTTALPDDKGEAGTGLTLDYYGEATVTEAGTWDVEYQVTMDPYGSYSPDPWDTWGRLWLALFLQVTEPGGNVVEYYPGPPGSPTGYPPAQTVKMLDTWPSGGAVLNIRDRRTFPLGYRFRPYVVANHQKGAANINQDASFLKISRVA